MIWRSGVLTAWHTNQSSHPADSCVNREASKEEEEEEEVVVSGRERETSLSKFIIFIVCDLISKFSRLSGATAINMKNEIACHFFSHQAQNFQEPRE